MSVTRRFVVVCLVSGFLAMLVLVACDRAATVSGAPAVPGAGAATAAPEAPAPRLFAQLDLAASTGECAGPDVGAPVRPTLKPYKVSSTFKEVANIRQVSGELDRTGRRKLAEDLFVVKPTKLEQIFYMSGYNDEAGVPSFITLDAVLHLWHMTFDYTLRYLERTSLTQAVGQLTTDLLASALKAHAGASSELSREAAARVAAYFAVPARLLELSDLPKLPPEAEQWVAEDLRRIEQHSAMAKSAVTGFDVSFDLFKPRGHYTRRPEYERFFKAMSWYGNACWAFPDAGDSRGPTSAACAALLGKLLLGRDADAQLLALWRKVYEATEWFVGSADDPTPQELWPLVQEVYGGEPSLADLGDRAKAAGLCSRAAQDLRAPLIRPTTTDLHLIAVRFMGTRFIPDSYVHHNLVWDRVAQRTAEDRRLLPRGLDVPAALGSARALRHLTELYDDDRFPGFTDQMTAMRQWLRDQPAERWVSNLYWGWVWVLSGLTEPRGEGYPSFMTNDAWTDKQLWTALASWAELRHDTILYTKQPMAEGEGPDVPPPPKGYVEPDVQAWRRLEALADLSLRGLLDRGLLAKDDDLAFSLEDTRDLIGKLRLIAEKELTGQAITSEEYDLIYYVGGMICGLQLELLRRAEDQAAGHWWEIERPEERRMACIADVASGGGNALEVAVGPAYTIYVICPIDGKLTAARGAVFSYFEFPWPASDRLTDEQWNAMLDAGKAPDAPEWAGSFLTGLSAPAGPWREMLTP